MIFITDANKIFVKVLPYSLDSHFKKFCKIRNRLLAIWNKHSSSFFFFLRWRRRENIFVLFSICSSPMILVLLLSRGVAMAKCNRILVMVVAGCGRSFQHLCHLLEFCLKLCLQNSDIYACSKGLLLSPLLRGQWLKPTFVSQTVTTCT